MKLHPNIKYRSDIDGLRAVAVISVILFHINSNWISGGFLGVDIFFVLSGYLITLILIKEIESTRTISISNFYKRRIKRIMPALLFVLIPTIIIGFMLFTPNDFVALLKSSIWALFSSANIYFFSSIETGYFATGSNELPLLHLWSLGVEEQFYILWPFLVLFLLKYIPSIRKQMLLIAILFTLSLIWAQSIIVSNHSFAYYMLPTRAWELLSGATIALLVHHGFRQSNKLNELMAGIGFITIILSLLFVSDSDPVPGVAALPTILGTSLIILAGTSYQTYVGRLLSFRALVAIGLVSYSAYLWHWPILAFLHYAMVEINLYISILIILLTFALATLSYLFIETPLRKNHLSNKKIFILYFIAPVLTIAILSTLLIQVIAFRPSWVYSEKKLDKAFLILPNHKYNYSCLSSNFTTDALHEERCIYPKKSKPTVLIIGDSNAAHYVGMIRVFSDKYGFTTKNITQSACPLVLNEKNYPWITKEYQEGCLAYRRNILEEAEKYDTLIIGGNWSSYDYNEFREDFSTTINIFSKKAKKIIILGKIPIMSSYSKDCAERSLKMPWVECAKKFKSSGKELKMNKFIQELSEQYTNISYFDIRNQTCKGEACSPYLEGKPIYYDKGHLSMSGSKLIAEIMIKKSDPMIKVFEEITKK